MRVEPESTTRARARTDRCPTARRMARAAVQEMTGTRRAGGVEAACGQGEPAQQTRRQSISDRSGASGPLAVAARTLADHAGGGVGGPAVRRRRVFRPARELLTMGLPGSGLPNGLTGLARRVIAIE